MVKYLSTLLNKYFNILKYFGYNRYISVDKILVVSFIQETIDEDMCYVSDEDKLDMRNALSCIYGSECLFPFPDKKAGNSIGCNGKSL